MRAKGSPVVYEVKNGRKLVLVDTQRATLRNVVEISAAELEQILDMPLDTRYSEPSPSIAPIHSDMPYVAPGGVLIQQRQTFPVDRALPAPRPAAPNPDFVLPPPPPVGER